MELVGPLIVLITFPLVIAWAFWYTSQRKKKVTIGLGKIAYDLDLRLIPGKSTFWNKKFDHLAGYYKGSSLRIVPREEKRGKSSLFYTDFIMDCQNPKRLHLLIEEENLLNVIGDWLGMGDLKIGNQQFDDRFRIKAQESNQLRSILNSNTRDEIHKLFNLRSRNASLKIAGKELIYTEEALPGVDNVEARAGIIADALLSIEKRMEVMDWGDESGESWWDENQSGMIEVIQ